MISTAGWTCTSPRERRFPWIPRREPTNRLYRNLGNWQFEDVTVEARAGHNGFSAGLAVGDYDSDGVPDIYVTCLGPNCLLHNEGDGTFSRVEIAAGVADSRWVASAAFLDYDEDGLLDLDVCNYAKWLWEKNLFCGDPARGVRTYCIRCSTVPTGPRPLPQRRKRDLSRRG